jgi:hypothetical protein
MLAMIAKRSALQPAKVPRSMAQLNAKFYAVAVAVKNVLSLVRKHAT